MLKKIAFFLSCALMLAASQSAFAIGFGRIAHNTSLGQMLEFTVPVTVDGTEQLTADCVSAEVFLGDFRVPPGSVISQLEWSADSSVRVLRVSTTVRVDEPVVNVTLAAGCPPRLTRQFVLFVDPPTQPVPVLAESQQAAPEVPVLVPVVPPVSVAGRADAQPGRVRSESRNGPAAGSQPTRSVEPRRTAKRSRAVKPDPAAAGALELAKPRVNAANTPGKAKRSARLRLEPADRSAEVAAAEQAAASAAELAASVASAAALAASEAQAAAQQQREALQAMQKQMDSLKTQAEAADRNIAQMRLSLRESQEWSDRLLLAAWLLGVVAVALLAGVFWLLRQKVAAPADKASSSWWNADSQRSAESTQLDAKAVPPASMPPVADDSLAWPSGPSVQDTAVDVLTAMDSLRGYADEPVAEPAISLKPKAVPLASATELPWLSADELIDLEQQAEFFVALGQDDSAVSLLEQQLCGVGGGGAWPYLKLLEIYRRIEDRDSYERVREGLDRRFGPSPTGWTDGRTSGRPLDSYPELTRRIESAWIEPAQAMRLIESLMVHGDEESGVFDLTAMADLQSLYLLARASMASQSSEVDTVDFLLPLEPEGSETGYPQTQNQIMNAAESTVDFNLELLPPTQDPASRG
jgi:hypothetical protein